MSVTNAIHMNTGQPSFDAVSFDRAPAVEVSLRADDGIGALTVTHPEPWEADMPDHPEHVLLVRLKPSSAPVEVRVADRSYTSRMAVGSFALLPAGAPSRWRDRGRGLRGLHVNLAPRVFERLVADDDEARPLRDLPPIDWTEDPVMARLAQQLLAHLARGELEREAERQRHADADRLAMQQGAAVIPGLRLQRMGEGVAQVQQRAPALGLLLALVALDHPRLGETRPPHRLGLELGIAREQGRTVRLAPGEELGIVDQPVLHHLGIARAELARRQGGQRGGVAQH